LENYRNRLSGPFLDRIDLQVEVPRLSHDELFDLEPAEPSALVRARIIEARRFRASRLAGQGVEETGIASLRPHVRRFLRQLLAFDRSSARAVDRIVGVARTIADLAVSCEIEEQHVAEALLFRRNLWAGQ
jgi:magnesium chelatase family protein